MVDWKDVYPDANEAIPPNVPEPRGKCLQLNCFVDAFHAGNRITRRSHTGEFFFLCCAPVLWYLKEQNMFETSFFWFGINCCEDSYGNDSNTMIKPVYDGYNY